MNKLQQIVLTSAIALGLSFGAAQYANGQNVAGRPGTPDLRKSTIMAGSISRYKDNLKGKDIRAPPGNYMLKGDTIYIQGIDPDTPQQFCIMEFVAKPQDKNLIEMLLHAEINSRDDQTYMYFRAAENWDGNTVKTNYIQIGTNPAYIFEAANKKETK